MIAYFRTGSAWFLTSCLPFCFDVTGMLTGRIDKCGIENKARDFMSGAFLWGECAHGSMEIANGTV